MSIFYKAQAIADLLGVAAPQVRQLANAGKIMTKMEDGQQLVSADSLVDLASDSDFGLLKSALPAFIKGQGVGTGSAFPLSAVAGLLGGNNNSITEMIAKGALSAITDSGEQKVTGSSLMGLLGGNAKYSGILGMLGSFALQQIGFKKAGRFATPAVAALLRIGLPALKKLMADGFLSGDDDYVDADSLSRLVNGDDKYSSLKDKLGDFAFRQLGFDIPEADDADNYVSGVVETESAATHHVDAHAEEEVVERVERVEKAAPAQTTYEKAKPAPDRVAQHVEPEKSGGGLPGWLFPLLGLLALAVIGFAVLQSCGGDDADSGDNGSGTVEYTDDDCALEEVLCVGLITDVGEVDDKSFNQSAWEGAQLAEDELGAIVNYIETQDAKDYADNIALFADKAYDVIVTVGFAMGEATAAAAGDYPDINFIGVDQFQGATVDNVAGLIFAEDRAGFLAGALAAQLSQSGSVAQVLGTDLVPPVVAFGEGFEAGALHINPDIEVSTTYHPGGMDVAFTDPEWGATTAKQALDNGADVIFGAGGKTGNGALIEVASQDGAYCIGVDSDQWETVPEAHPCLVSSAMKLITPGVFDLVTLSNDGEFEGGNFVGDVGLADFHDFDDTVSDDIKSTLETLESDLASGALSTGYNP